MKISATFHMNGLLEEQANLDRFQRESTALERLSSAEVDALCSVLDAGDAGALVPKLYRLMIVNRQPDTLLARMLAEDPGGPGVLVTFALELASFRLFMDRLLAGEERARHGQRRRARAARLAARPERALPRPGAAPSGRRRGQ